MSAGLDANNMPSGTAATAGLHKFAFTAVGAPMAGRGGDELAVLLRNRHVVFIGDSDGVPRQSNPGVLSAGVAGVCGISSRASDQRRRRAATSPPKPSTTAAPGAGMGWVQSRASVLWVSKL